VFLSLQPRGTFHRLDLRNYHAVAAIGLGPRQVGFFAFQFLGQALNFGAR
jgi:hypothetical protein